MDNRLAAETSPYLQQHAANPVDWYPWGEEALALAREQDKPILLSIGYSACHWCHVMAHESFEDAEVAAEMNGHFVNIKVDREERPDLDQIYQTAHHVLTRRSGGWPLTVFLTPGGVPFFAGTYFPKHARYGMPGFKDLLSRVATAYREQRAEIERQNASLMAALAHATPEGATERELTRVPIDSALREIAQMFDNVHGGLGRAPKFPHPYELHFCLRRHAMDGGTVSRTIVELTLTKMAEGGIFDQLGGGFCRYSTDDDWTIPHFEKMLYDNGPLLALFTDAWLVTQQPLYARIAQRTAEWVMREMQGRQDNGPTGYYSSLDADSEGVEGKFYVWTREEAAGLLEPDEYAVAAAYYGLDGPPNFEGRFWNLRVTKPLVDVALALGVSEEDCAHRLQSAREKLYAARERRIRPGRDEKVLTSWNALMIRGMARAGRFFGRPEWLESAKGAVDFLQATLWQQGRLLATCKDGRAHLNAYLDDHAFLLDALLELMQADFRPGDLDFARALAEALLERFEDAERGGFYFVSHDHEPLILRPRTGHDGATPSGNGVAACALQRLGHLLGEPRYLAAAERTIRAFHEGLENHASSHTTLATALEEALRPPRLVVIRGAPDEAQAWRCRLDRTYRPDTMIFVVPPEVRGLPGPPHEPAAAQAHRVSAALCSGVTCLPPAFDVVELEQALARGSSLP